MHYYCSFAKNNENYNLLTENQDPCTPVKRTAEFESELVKSTNADEEYAMQ